MRILMIGFGNVGQKIAEIFSMQPEDPKLSVLNPAIIGIFTANHGAVANASGLPLKNCLEFYRKYKAFNAGYAHYFRGTVMEALHLLVYDVMIEVSTLSIENHGEPAASYVMRALEAGRHVVLANKGPIAFRYRELSKLADNKKVYLLYESTVMDGTPVFSFSKTGLIGCKVTAISGIFNSTTNVVLDDLRRGQSIEQAIHYAQTLGIAEADPRLDLDGWDCAVKLSVLGNVLMGTDIYPTQIPRDEFTPAMPDLVRQAYRSGKYIRQVGKIWPEYGKVYFKVAFLPLSDADPFAGVSGTSSAIRIETDRMCPQVILQENPGLADTAYGIINDLLTIHGAGSGMPVKVQTA